MADDAGVEVEPWTVPVKVASDHCLGLMLWGEGPSEESLKTGVLVGHDRGQKGCGDGVSEGAHSSVLHLVLSARQRWLPLIWKDCTASHWPTLVWSWP